VANESSVLVVGAGVTGLLTAYELGRAIGFENVRVADQCPDPRTLTGLTHNGGATYSGGDARHVSITESSMMANKQRAILIDIPAATGGWLGRGDDAPDQFRKSFARAGNDIHLLRREDEGIFALNRAGMERWFALEGELPDVVRPVSEQRTLAIFCASGELLSGEFGAERALDPGRVRRLSDIGEGYGPVPKSLSRAGRGGAFEVAGAAYHGKTLCASLITELARRGVEFCVEPAHRARFPQISGRQLCR